MKKVKVEQDVYRDPKTVVVSHGIPLLLFDNRVVYPSSKANVRKTIHEVKSRLHDPKNDLHSRGFLPHYPHFSRGGEWGTLMKNVLTFIFFPLAFMKITR